MNDKRGFDKKQIRICALIAAAAVVVIAAAAVMPFILRNKPVQAQAKKAEGSLFAMDTYMTFTAYGENAEEAIGEAKALIQSLETLWSVTDEASEIGRLNRDRTATVSEATMQVLSLSKEYSEYTGGCFDPTVYPLVRAWGFTTGEYRVLSSDEIDALLNNVGIDGLTLDGKDTASVSEGCMVDMGGIAKGYAGDLVSELLKGKGIDNAIISLGGNIQTIGKKPDGSDWNVGIQSPYDDSLIGVLAVDGKCVITSGAYERYFQAEDGTLYGHIISPFSGRPVSNELMSVTVVCDRGSMGDALSTALFVMGADRAMEFWRAHEGFDIVLMTRDGTVYVSEGIFPSFTQRQNKDVASVCEIKR